MKVKDLKNVGVLHIVDDYTCEPVETIKFKDAVAKYGECTVKNSYTDKILPDKSFLKTIWIEKEDAK